MLTLKTLVLVIHVLVAALMIGLVLLQRGKGAEAGAAFGAGASGTVFGARGSANFLSRSTAVLATLFFATSLGLAYLGGQQAPTSSVLDLDPAAAVEMAPESAESVENDLPGLPEDSPAAADEQADDLPELPASDQ